MTCHVYTFIFWPHGSEKLGDFLNSIHPNTQFTTETESDDRLPFLDAETENTEWNLVSHCMQEADQHRPLYECQITTPSGVYAFRTCHHSTQN